MTETAIPDTPSLLAAEYVLGLLPPEARAEVEARLPRDAVLREEVRFWTEDLVSLTDPIAPVRPPRGMQAAIEARLFGAPARAPGLMARLGTLLGTGGALVAGAVALLILAGPPANLRGNDLVAEVAAEDRSLVLQASFDPDTNRLSLRRAAGAARDGRALELWLIQGENAPVSLGVLPDSAEVTLTLQAELAPLFSGGLLAISDEPPGGSPTGAPTGDVLAVGPVVNI